MNAQPRHRHAGRSSHSHLRCADNGRNRCCGCGIVVMWRSQTSIWAFLAALALLAGCDKAAVDRPDGGAKADNRTDLPAKDFHFLFPGTEKHEPRELPVEYLRPWIDAGAERGWLSINEFGFLAFGQWPGGNAVPAFKFRTLLHDLLPMPP